MAQVMEDLPELTKERIAAAQIHDRDLPRRKRTMLQQITRKITPAAVVILFSLFAPALRAEVAEPVFNVKTYGATGKKADNAKPAIQKAIDACAKAGGGTVYLPPGDYTSGTLRLRSHVRFYVASGATLFAAEEDPAFDTDGSLVGEDLENITIEGRGG